jgi:hypothetical protein
MLPQGSAVPSQNGSSHVHPAWRVQGPGPPNVGQLRAVPTHTAQSAFVQQSPPLLQTPPQQTPPGQDVMLASCGYWHVPLPEQVLPVQGFPSSQSALSQHCLQPAVQQLGVEPEHVSVQVPHAQPLEHVRTPGQLVPDGVHVSVSPVKHSLPVLSEQLPQLPQLQPDPQLRERVPQLPAPQSSDPTSPAKHWLVALSEQLPQLAQLQSSPQVCVWAPQLPPPQSWDSVDPGVVQSHMLFSQGPHVQEAPQSWPPTHEAVRMQACLEPMMHSKSSSTWPLQSLSTASHCSVVPVIVHSQPFSRMPSALPKPKSHEMPQVPSTQVGTAWSRVGHAAPQALQLEGSTWRSAQ